LSFASAEGSPDNLVSVFADHSELWLFGNNTIEIFYSTGNADSPFQRINNAFIERGCSAKFSVSKDDNTVFWLGDDFVIYRANGYSPQRISTHAIEKAIAGYTSVSDAFSFNYTQEGHKFYCIIFPSAGKTWVFDISTGMWHERETYNETRWRINCHEFIYGKNLVGDFSSGLIYELDLDTYTDNSQIIQRICTFPTIFQDNKRIFYDYLRIDLDAGIGLNSGQGSEPLIWLDWSDDGGRTYSNQHFRSMGKIGEYTRRATWRRLGSSRERIYRCSISDPVKIAITGAYAEVRAGDTR